MNLNNWNEEYDELLKEINLIDDESIQRVKNRNLKTTNKNKWLIPVLTPLLAIFLIIGINKFTTEAPPVLPNTNLPLEQTENIYTLPPEQIEKIYSSSQEFAEDALTKFYKAIWNGEDIQLDSYISNPYLKEYTQIKINYEKEQKLKLRNYVKNVVINDITQETIEWNNKEYFYIRLAVEVQFEIGASGEATEFLLEKKDNQYQIVDWYTPSKDSYDFMVRGENEKINNPVIWDDLDWVNEVQNRHLNIKDVDNKYLSKYFSYKSYN